MLKKNMAIHGYNSDEAVYLEQHRVQPDLPFLVGAFLVKRARLLQWLPCVRSRHGTLAKIHGNFLASLAKILP